MAPIQMRNLTTFPVERLYFDLKLEVLEQLDAIDVVELVKVNQGFQWMISNRPSIVFGHYVDDIGLQFEELNIKKLNSESLEVTLDVIRHFPFIKNIRSCNQLWMYKHYDSPIDKDHAAFLKQLQAVNSLYLDWCPAQHLELLSHSSVKFKRYARLSSLDQKAPSAKGHLGRFIEAQLNECEVVEFGCVDDDEFQFYYDASKKTHIKSVGFGCGYSQDFIVSAIERIVNHGIPSKNPAAVVRIRHHDVGADVKDTIVVFLKGYPRMKQIKGKRRQPFVALANDRLKGSRNDEREMNTDRDEERDEHRSFTRKDLCFRRNINATRDCIYMLSSTKWRRRGGIDLFAFYLRPDEMIDR